MDVRRGAQGAPAGARCREDTPHRQPPRTTNASYSRALDNCHPTISASPSTRDIIKRTHRFTSQPMQRTRGVSAIHSQSPALSRDLELEHLASPVLRYIAFGLSRREWLAKANRGIAPAVKKTGA